MLYPDRRLNDAVLNFIVNINNKGSEERYALTTDETLRQTLRRLVNNNTKQIVAVIGIPTTPFSSYTFTKAAQLYGFTNDTQPDRAIPGFSCGCKRVDDDDYAQNALKKLFTELDTRLQTTPNSIANEATKSVYTFSFLAAAVSLFSKTFQVCLEEYVEGLNGQGNVDLAVVSLTSNLVVGITEVKKDDFVLGIGQNIVQLESALVRDFSYIILFFSFFQYIANIYKFPKQ